MTLLAPFPTATWIENKLNTLKDPPVLLRLDFESRQFDLLMGRLLDEQLRMFTRLCEHFQFDSSLWHCFTDTHYPDVLIMAQINGPYCPYQPGNSMRVVWPTESFWTLWDKE